MIDFKDAQNLVARKVRQFHGLDFHEMFVITQMLKIHPHTKDNWSLNQYGEELEIFSYLLHLY